VAAIPWIIACLLIFVVAPLQWREDQDQWVLAFLFFLAITVVAIFGLSTPLPLLYTGILLAITVGLAVYLFIRR
jgi:hypothetical protein